MSKRNSKIKYDGIDAVDLFCGGGGLTCGLRQTGIDVRMGVDFDGRCEYAYEHNNDFCQNRNTDAKSLLIKFIRRAKKELIVIDAYPGVANGECCQCVNVAVTAPSGGSQPIGTRTRRAKREPSGQFQFPIEEAA